MDRRTTTMAEYLEQALRLENQFERTLAAHISAAPGGDYRALLERHRANTAGHARRIGTRLRELGVQRSLPALGLGLLQGAAQQALTVAKAPLGLLGRPGDEEQLVSNARDELASEGSQIALYDVIEALADRLDDGRTALLAREHRLQELLFVDDLRGVVPTLVDGLVDARVDGGRLSAGRAARAREEERSRSVADAATDEAAEAVLDRREDARLRAPAAGTDQGGEPLPLQLPIEGYDGLTVVQILPRLEALSADELAAIDGYERAGRTRKQVLNRVQALRNRQTDELLSRLS
jgi:hypothetical protein